MARFRDEGKIRKDLGWKKLGKVIQDKNNIVGTAVADSKVGNVCNVVLSGESPWPESVLGPVDRSNPALYVAEHMYRSLDSCRWAHESTHYLNNPTPASFPITIKTLKFYQFKIMRTAMYRIIKEHFFIPLSFKITEVIYPTQPQTLHKRTMACEQTNFPVTIRALATAKPCEREVNKCNKCDRRYRCITQREA